MAVLQPGYELAEVMVTVKTYPTPSERHIETVCVAGVRLDTPTPQWIRLYPIPFRVMGFDYQFGKYQIVRVPVQARGTKDPRPESYSPDNSKLELGEKFDTGRNWARRRDLLGPLVGERTVCELIAANRAVRMNQPAPSLGLVKAEDVHLSIQEGRPWKPNQAAKARRAVEPTLFDEAAIRNELEPMPYEIKLRYKCQESGCRGHNQTLIDWEVGAAAFNWKNHYDEASIPGRLLKKWESMFTPERDSHVFVGNQHQYRHSFSALGVWSPKK